MQAGDPALGPLDQRFDLRLGHGPPERVFEVPMCFLLVEPEIGLPHFVQKPPPPQSAQG